MFCSKLQIDCMFQEVQDVQRGSEGPAGQGDGRPQPHKVHRGTRTGTVVHEYNEFFFSFSIVEWIQLKWNTTLYVYFLLFLKIFLLFLHIFYIQLFFTFSNGIYSN